MSEERRLLTAEQARTKLEDRKLSFVAEKVGLTYMSLSRLMKGIGDPSLKTLQKLSDYFHERP